MVCGVNDKGLWIVINNFWVKVDSEDIVSCFMDMVICCAIGTGTWLGGLL